MTLDLVSPASSFSFLPLASASFPFGFSRIVFHCSGYDRLDDHFDILGAKNSRFVFVSMDFTSSELTGYVDFMEF